MFRRRSGAGRMTGGTMDAGHTLIATVEGMTYQGLLPFHERSMALLGAISRALLASPQARTQPQYVALGYWLRPASLARLRDQFSREMPEYGSVTAPRGMALHLPPTNVDTIFVYSWAVSVLAGNCNVVRLPTSMDANLVWLSGLIREVIADNGEAARHVFAQWPHHGATNDGISACADLRMIWGGDEKVRDASQVMIRPDGLSIGFPDRKSLAIIAAGAYAATDDAGRQDLAYRLANDIYWFNQMGCGSPRVLVWVGDPGDLAAELYARLNAIAEGQSFAQDAAVSVSRFFQANDLLAAGTVTGARRYGPSLDIVTADAIEPVLNQSQGGGFLAQTMVADVCDIAPAISRRVQTLTHFGLSQDDVSRLAHAIVGRGGYRIVPVGQALQFDVNWDGISLLSHMTRRIVTL